MLSCIPMATTIISDAVDEWKRTHISRERVEEGPILVIGKVIVQLILPSNASRALKVLQHVRTEKRMWDVSAYLEVDHAEIEGHSLLIIKKSDRTLLSDVRPVGRIRVCIIYSAVCGGKDVTSALRACCFDFRLLVL